MNDDTTKKRGPGRPPGPTGKAREGVIRLRAHKAEIARWRARAESEGVSLSEWVRARLNSARGR